MYIIAGLGNPTSKYTMTRHNVGFRTIEELAKRKEKWKPIERAAEKGLLARYANSVSTARKGATLR